MTLYFAAVFAVASLLARFYARPLNLAIRAVYDRSAAARLNVPSPLAIMPTAMPGAPKMSRTSSPE